jgi:N-methylhydantoinase A
VTRKIGTLKVGIDVGGTFTDFLLVRDDAEPEIFKTLSTPQDPSIGLVNGLTDIAKSLGQTLEELAPTIDTIVHGTTVTTNATLTRTGAKTGLLTTEGVRDALEMRRGIREEQYNNRYTNVPPLVPRYLRRPVKGRLDRMGRETTAMQMADVEAAIEIFQTEAVDAVAICFMNSFANPEHEKAAAELVAKAMPDAYLSVSAELLPSIRFYNRVSSTVLNSYNGPKLKAYLDALQARLKDIGFAGVLLIMQSNGGVVLPETAKEAAAMTLLSGPAAGPVAGLGYAEAHGQRNCLTVDMGGTSFDAAMVIDGVPITATEGEINRYRIALPMLDIVTIGAGGGSIGWIDEGGLLRMGPQSAGADPGPVCYGQGGENPACTDADLVLGYLSPDYFAGGRMKLDIDKARQAIDEKIAKPLGMSIEEAALGMYRVINTNMAQGVREITIKRGLDPREFPMVVAGGAGPNHACMIGQELEIPLLLVPRESSIFCAAGMLMSDLKHDFVRSYVGRIDEADWNGLNGLINGMKAEGDALLENEGIPQDQREYVLRLDCRYAKQYHEVAMEAPLDAVAAGDGDTIKNLFHGEHNRLYGYSLEDVGTHVEIINVRVQCIGVTDKPEYSEEAYAGSDPAAAQKGERKIIVPETAEWATVPVYDGHNTKYGYQIKGPAIIEQENTSILVTASYDCVCDKYGSFAVYQKGREELVKPILEAA